MNDDTACGCPDDASEENDTQVTAVVLPVGTFAADLHAAWQDDDWWRIEAVPGTRIVVDVVGPVSAELFDSLGRGDFAYVDGFFDATVRFGDSVFLRVAAAGGALCASYSLRVEVEPPPTAPLVCNDICPLLACYTSECNAQGYCEYRPWERSGWHGQEVLIWVPPGLATMGSDGGPVVTFEEGYWIDKYEVRAGELAAFLTSDLLNGDFRERDPQGYTIAWDEATQTAVVAEHCETGTGGDLGSCAEHPATYVPWGVAEDYCEARGSHLCSEAQWERAAKGDTHRAFPWGDAPAPGGVDWDPPRANCAEDECADGFVRTAPVDAFPDGVSPVGCYGMAGNVAEWVWDIWGVLNAERLPADLPADGHPWFGLSRGDVQAQRVVRGGAWRRFEGDGSLLEARRGSWRGWDWIGFRCCRTRWSWSGIGTEDVPYCE